MYRNYRKYRSAASLVHFIQILNIFEHLQTCDCKNLKLSEVGWLLVFKANSLMKDLAYGWSVLYGGLSTGS